MSTEQVVRSAVSAMNTGPTEFLKYCGDGAVFSGGLSPQPAPLSETITALAGVWDAAPDLNFAISDVRLEGDQATVGVQISGTHTRLLATSAPEVPTIPATGKKFSVPDTFVFKVYDDKISAFHVNSPAHGGLGEILRLLSTEAVASG